MRYRVAVITVSDKGAAGEREDRSGPAVAEKVCAAADVVAMEIVPDEQDVIISLLTRICDEDLADVILTTGGTGFSLRDVTPEATQQVIERATPGITEAMRAKSLQITDRAMLSRAAAGIRKKTLIVNLPGSPKAARECLGFLLPTLWHGVDILRGYDGECAR